MSQSSPPAGLRLFRLFGIDVYLHWTWALALYLAFQWHGDAYDSPVWVVLACLTLFLIVLLHEFGHSLACLSVGGIASHIMLWPLGGVAFVNPPPRPGALLWSIVAGPLVNVLLIPVTVGAFFWLAPPSGDLHTFLKYIMIINAALLIFNLLPIYPLDGGQIVRALLWFILGRVNSLVISAILGLIGAGVLALIALTWLNSVWMMIMAVYAGFLSWQGFQQAQGLRQFEALPRHAGFACPHCRQSPPIGEFWRCENCHEPIDPFVDSASCRRCGQPNGSTPCLDCGQAAPPILWQRSGPVPTNWA